MSKSFTYLVCYNFNFRQTSKLYTKILLSWDVPRGKINEPLLMIFISILIFFIPN